MGIVIHGEIEEVPGLSVLSWHDEEALRLVKGEDCRRRYTPWVRGIVLHTTKGVPGGRDKRPQQILPGRGPSKGRAFRVAWCWSMDNRNAGAHLIVDFDGTVACLADLQSEAAFHAGEVNEVTIGIELYQGDDAELYDGQLDCTVRLLDYLTRRFRIQRQIQWPYHCGPVERMATGGRDVVGIYGHRDVTTNRGAGDPGDAIFEQLRAAGYEAFDFERGEDRVVWTQRQAHLNCEFGTDLIEDGLPGPKTTAALERAGKPYGLWVPRPGDR